MYHCNSIFQVNWACTALAARDAFFFLNLPITTILTSTKLGYFVGVFFCSLNKDNRCLFWHRKHSSKATLWLPLPPFSLTVSKTLASSYSSQHRSQQKLQVLNPSQKYRPLQKRWFWNMKTGLSIHGTPKRGITPTTRKNHGRYPFLSLLTATSSNRFRKFVCLKSLQRIESKRQDLSPFPPLYQHVDNTLAPTTYGKSNRLCKLPGHYFGMLQKTNMQPMDSATTCKSELLFALYLYLICVSTATLSQAVSAAVGTGCRPWDSPQTKSSEQVRHRDHCRNSHSRLYFTTRSQPVEQHKEGLTG